MLSFIEENKDKYDFYTCRGQNKDYYFVQSFLWYQGFHCEKWPDIAKFNKFLTGQDPKMGGHDLWLALISTPVYVQSNLDISNTR